MPTSLHIHSALQLDLADPARLAALHRLALLDTPPEDEFDRIARPALHVAGARGAYVNLLDERRTFSKSMVGPVVMHDRREFPVDQSLCEYVVRRAQTLLVEDLGQHPEMRDHPARARGVEAYLGVPLRSPDGYVVGTLCVIDTSPNPWGSAAVESLQDLAGSLEELLRGRELADEVVLRSRRETALREQTQLAELTADVSLTLARGGALRDVLQHCSEKVVQCLDAAFARVWLLNEAEQVLELQASAGMYTHLDGPHGRVPVGKFKIGTIAAERRPHLTNQVVGDPRVSEQEWAKREGMVAFAGYPLLVGDRMAGVIAAFARHRLSDAALDTLGVVANALAVGIDRIAAEERVRDSEARKSAMMEAALDCVLTIDCHGKVLEWNPSAERTFGYTREEALGREMAELIVPPALRGAHRAGMERYLATGEGRVIGRRIEITAIHRDGREMPVELAITRVPGTTPAFTGYLRDITDRKRAERERTVLLAREQMAKVEAEAAEQRARFLSEAGRVLASSLAVETIAGSAARLTVPFLADWCAVDLLQEDGSLQRGAVADMFHRDTDFSAGLHQLAGVADTGQLLRQVACTGEPLLIGDASAAMRAHGLMPGSGPPIEAALVVPLRTGSTCYGVLVALALEAGRRYDDADLALARELGARTTVALDNARLHREVAEARVELEQQNEELAVQSTHLAEVNTELEMQSEELTVQQTHLEEINGELEALNETLEERSAEAELARAEAERLVIELRHSESRLRELAESIPVHVWTATPDGALDFVTQRCACYFGRTPDEVIAAGWQEVVHPDDLPGVIERWIHSLKTGEPYEVEFRLLCAAEGTYRWHLGRALALRDSSGQIERWFGTNMDLHAEKLAEQERDDARAEAEKARQSALAASDAKTRFLNVMSHELRTPLGAIGGYADLMDMGIYGDITTEQRNCVKRIQHNQAHLLRLVNELLDLAKIESGQLILNIEAVSIAEVMERVFEMVQPQALSKALELKTQLPDREVRARADRDRLVQLVLNLVANAVKFTPSGGHIVLAAESTGDTVALRVQDTGIGIPADKLDSVFDAFVQVQSPLTRNTLGTGLGLAISRELVRRMGGEISLVSEQGTGSTFTVMLALAS